MRVSPGASNPHSPWYRGGLRKSAEQHVPDRKVGVVVVVDAHPVVDAVRLGPLDAIAQPLRRPHVPVLEDSVDGRITDQRRRERLEAQHDDGDEELQQPDLQHHLERVKDHRARDVDAARTVVELVDQAPEGGHVVYGAMPSSAPDSTR